MSTTNPTFFKYNGENKYLKECDNCRNAGAPGRHIFFINKGVKPNGKTDWELREQIGTTDESKIHEHTKKAGGNFRAKPKDVDAVTLAKLSGNHEADYANIKALQVEGWKVNRLYDGEVQVVVLEGKPCLVLVKEQSS